MSKRNIPEDVREYFRQQGAVGGEIGGRKRWERIPIEERSRIARELAAKSVAARRQKPRQDGGSPITKEQMPEHVREYFRQQGAIGGRTGGKKRWEGIPIKERSRMAREWAAKSVAARRQKAIEDSARGLSD